MTLDIISLQPLMDHGRFCFTPVGLIIAEDTSYEDWQAAGITLQRLEEAIQFAIGDWLNFGEHHYGEKYSQAVEATERKYPTLSNYAYVCSRVPMSRRRENLSFSHHAEVASLSPQEQVDKLNMAEQMGLSTRELRSVIRGSNTGVTYLYTAQIIEMGSAVVLKILDGDIHTLLAMLGEQVIVMIDPAPTRRAGG